MDICDNVQFEDDANVCSIIKISISTYLLDCTFVFIL